MGQRGLQVALWILSRLIPERERESLVGDLTEEYALRARGASSSAALNWCFQQVCASAPPLVWAGLKRAAWLSTIGVAMLAYIAVGVVEWGVNRATSQPQGPLGLIIMFPVVTAIGYLAARFRRRAAVVLAAMMLAVVTAMTLWTDEVVPVWYRIAYFIVGPAAAGIGGALQSHRSPD